MRGALLELSVDAGGEAVLVDPAWEPAGRMNVARGNGHTATLLMPSGKVLVAGGSLVSSDPPSAELYDPTDDTWSVVAPMRAWRRGYTATGLPDDEVLVVGGGEEGGVGAVELYDPVTDTWTPRASMARPRLFHTATLLLNGKVLVTGGRTDAYRIASAELYDPMTDTWTLAAPMHAARERHGAALLRPSGKVLVAGGSASGAPRGSAELYDPEADTWTPTGSLANVQWSPMAMTQLHNGEVLAVGDSRRAARYNPTAGTWSRTSPMLGRQGASSATPLQNGKVLVAGESGDVSDRPGRSAELYDPETDTWVLTAPTNAPYEEHSATPLLNGEVLLISSSRYPERFTIVGAECASDADCGPAACVDGVCCESRCSEPCHTCAMPSSLGRCVLQLKGWDARSECARKGCDGSCDGLGSCSAVPKDDECVPAQCSDETHSMARVLCPADGASCGGPSSEAREVADCAPYRCDPASGTCKGRCSSLQDCVPGHACDFSGHCVRPPPAANPGCSVAPAVAASGASRRGLGAVILALLVAARRSPAFRGKSTRRRGGC